MKRLLSFLLIIALVIGLTACGGGKQETPAQPEKPEEEKGSAIEETDDSLEALLGRGESPDNISYELYIETEGFVSEGKVYIKGNNMRTEFNNDGITSIYIENASEGYSYIYMPEENTATKIPHGSEEEDWAADDSGAVTPDEYLQDIVYDDSLEELGKETINGMSCRVVRVKDGLNGDSKIWISEALAIPVRIESNIEGIKSLIEFRNLEVGKVTDDIFKLPPGVEIMDMEALFGDFEMPEMEED